MSVEITRGGAYGVQFKLVPHGYENSYVEINSNHNWELYMEDSSPCQIHIKSFDPMRNRNDNPSSIVLTGDEIDELIMALRIVKTEWEQAHGEDR